MDEDYMVTICAACRRASCWWGDNFCDDARGADTAEVPASVLAEERRENPRWFSRERIRRITGSDPTPVDEEVETDGHDIHHTR